MDSDSVVMFAEEKMEGVKKSYQDYLAKARTGRANPKMFEGVTIEYYGVETPISQISSISVPEGNQLYIKPYDKTSLPLIEKAIFASNLGVTPMNDGVGIRIVLPLMTEENRNAVCKDIKKVCEDYKVQIRNARQDANGELKKNEKDKEISEDELELYLKDVQDMTDKFISELEALLEAKTKEIQTI